MAGSYRSSNSTAPGHGAKNITPSDSTIFPATRALYIGTAGAVVVTMADGDVVTFQNVANGTLLPIQTVQVFSTGTSATNIIAIY